MLSYCPMGPMENAIRAVPSHPIPWDISHGIPMGIPFPWTSLSKPEYHKIDGTIFLASNWVNLLKKKLTGPNDS